MKLRTRLFLWVGIIFLLAFGVSLFFETFLTDRSLQTAENQLREQILTLNEQRRKGIEEFLNVSLSEDQAQIDALLLHIAGDPTFGATLFLDPKNIEQVAPAHAAFLFKNDKWLDYIQSTKNGALTTLLIPIDFPMEEVRNYPIKNNLSWVVGKDKKPYLGVRLPPFKPVKTKESLSLIIDELLETDLGLTILFDPKMVLRFKRPLEVEKERVEHSVNIPVLLSALEEGAAYLSPHAGEGFEGWIEQDVKRLGGGALPGQDPIIACIDQEGQALNNRIVQLLQRGDQAIMIATLANLFPSGLFGDSPLSSKAPVGIARFLQGHATGHVALSKEVFYNQKFFDDADYVKTHPAKENCEGVGGSLAVIAPKDLRRVFIGNTLELKGKTKGFLTLGMDANLLVQDLVLSIGETAFLVHQDKVVSAFSKEGEVLDIKNIPFEKKMLDQKSGIVTWKGEGYYFQQMVPFKNLDLHFYLLTEEKKAFALVNTIKEGSEQVIKTVSLNMRLIAGVAFIVVLILLNGVARRITKPIAVLAKATEHVGAGRLDDVELPEPPKGHHDEIATLCTSFGDMVQGLKEKEKVKGVLNKVVSQEIAGEILKGNVHLGGEEKKVTVLFADIRDFTHLSASMAPNEVVEMLNTCMTKISHIVDEFGGVIDKYVGDEVMALFGAPLDKGDSALKAIQSALKMVEALAGWNQERSAKNLPPVEMGIGIHTGNVLVGNMGAENRLNYTVIGSNVNLAARLCSAAKGGQILITSETYNEPHVKDAIDVETLPPTELKGFDEKMELLAIKGARHV